MPRKASQYLPIIEKIFFNHYSEGATSVTFNREEINLVADALGVERIKNLGDIIYYFRYRHLLPKSITDLAPGKHWVIVDESESVYRFEIRDDIHIIPSPLMAVTKIPDSTPGVIRSYALDDEQSLLAMLRYNRLLDIFVGTACYSLQSHLKTKIDGSQTETDEIYIGIGRSGAHFVLPVQAKGHKDKLGIVQIERDFRLCEVKFPNLIARPIGAQFMKENVIALFDFVADVNLGVRVANEQHYRLVAPSELTPEELEEYRSRTLEPPRVSWRPIPLRGLVHVKKQQVLAGGA